MIDGRTDRHLGARGDNKTPVALDNDRLASSDGRRLVSTTVGGIDSDACMHACRSILRAAHDVTRLIMRFFDGCNIPHVNTHLLMAIVQVM